VRAAVLLAVVATTPFARAAEDAVEQRRAAIARELVAVGDALRREIVAKDVDALVARVPPVGLRCGARTVPRAKVARDLRAAGSWLHATFFGEATATGARSPQSLAELLRSRTDVAIAVSFVPDPRAGDTGRPCIDFRAPGVPTPGSPLCFEQRGGKWWFAESLYPCG
jgi:hypothetical protein